jgi:hypothetical protein
MAATDAEINDDLLDAGFSMPGSPILPSTLGCLPHQLAEDYYYNAKWNVVVQFDCGSGSDGFRRDWEDTTLGGIPVERRILLRFKVADDILSHASQYPGTVPGDLLRWAKKQTGFGIDWRRALSGEVRRGVGATSGLVDYSYSRPSRRSAVTPDVALPWLLHPSPELAIVIDTSQSMDSALLGKALAEVDSILRRVSQRRLRVIPCDAAAHGVQRVYSTRQVELIGGGGTDMREGIATARAMRPPADVIVVLTDGFTPWPNEAPKGVRIVIVLLGRGGPPAPSWARVISID